MADLVIPDLDDGIRTWLERRAREHSRTVAEEAREALRSVAAEAGEGDHGSDDPGGGCLVELATRLFGPENGFDLELPSRRDERERPPPDFSGPDYGR